MRTASRQIKPFLAAATLTLAPYLEEHGSLIYSTPATLCENPVLLYGINPGQNPTLNPTHHSNPLLKDSISNFPSQLNLIETERWLKPNGRSEYEPGQAPYQIRVAKILRHIGHPSALVTNLVFRQTPTSDSLPKGAEGTKLSDACWQVHENLLRITKAKAIIALGERAASGLRRNFGAKEIKTYPSGHGKWCCSWECGKWDDRRIDILRVPHLSYYKVDNHKGVLDWLKDSVEQRLSQAD